MAIQDSSIQEYGRSADSVPAFRILDTWLKHGWVNGIQIESLDDFTEIRVETRNSIYEITVIDPYSRSVVVRGGPFFKSKTSANLAGSSFNGGGFLKIGGIYAGFSLEFVTCEDTFVTTHVKSIQVFEPPTEALPD